MNYKGNILLNNFFQILTFTILIVSISFAAGKEKYPWTLIPIYKTNSRNVISVDLEDDGIEEIIECIGFFCQIKTQSGIVQRQFNFDTGVVYIVGAFDMDNDRNKEVVFSVTYDDRVLLKTFNNSGSKTLLGYKGKDIRVVSEFKYDSYFHHGITYDLNNDGNNDLIGFVHTGFDLYPRGLFAYDYKHNKELWHYWIAPTVSRQKPILYDLDGDTAKEIVFGTFSPCNGAVFDGIDDRKSWIFVLNRAGHLLWRKQIGDESTFTLIWVGDINSDTIVDIVACESYGLASNKEPHCITILNAQNGTIQKNRVIGERFLGMVVDDYDQDNKIEIITGNTDGSLRIFDENLELINEKKFPTAVEISAVADLDGNSKKEILLFTSNGEIAILNENLEIQCLYECQLGKIRNCQLIRNGKTFNIITQSDVKMKNEFIYTIYKVAETFTSPLIPTGYLKNIIIVLLSLTLIITISYHILFAKRMKKLISESPFGIIILNSDNKIVSYNSQAGKIIGETKEKISKFVETAEIKKMWTDAIEQKSLNVSLNDKNLSVDFKKVNNTKYLFIRDLSSEILANDIISWAGFAQKLAHEIKNPLSTINLTLQRIQSVCKEKLGKIGESIDKYTSSALEEVARLRETVDKFMRILSLEKPNIMLVNVNELLDKILGQHKLRKPRGIKIQKFYASDLPMIYCDESQIATTFSNIIENAFEAMGSKGILTVRTNVTDTINAHVSTNNKAHSATSTRLEQPYNLNTEFQTANNSQNIKGEEISSPATTAEIKKIQRYVEIRIEDTGEGMSEDQLNNLFRPFWTTKKSGTGLGLVIASRIIHIHKGKIEITSRKNLGTVVTILLPIQQYGNNAQQS